MFEDDSTEAVILIDASNAFNALNRKAALHNIQHLCPEFATFTKNLFRCDAELFLADSDDIILSEEGTTQGGPESMSFYAISTQLLARQDSGAKKLFYADDGLGRKFGRSAEFLEEPASAWSFAGIFS